MATKILLDTDIGTDVDDAVCLAYLLANPACELMGITTVTGDALRRAQLASALCGAAGKQVPIFPGSEQPLLIQQQQTQAQQAGALDLWPHAAGFPAGQAVRFLQETIRAYPGEIVLLTIGPLTNIALLFAMDPEIPALLKGLVMMCGVFLHRMNGGRLLETNAMLDPHATAIVYRHPARLHRSIGLDVTRQVSLAAATVREKFKGDLLRPVLDFAEIWFRRRDHLVFHDPLAAVTIFDESVCRFEPGQVEVELTSERLRGLTHWTPRSSGPHQVAVEVEPDRFFEAYFSVF
jgi:inosine-uridine nucleoside N-ribohydrolase